MQLCTIRPRHRHIPSWNVRTSLRCDRAGRRRGHGRSLGDGPRLPLGSGPLAHHRRVPTPRPGRSPRRARQTATARQAHGERQTSAGLELELRPMDVACRVHDCLRALVCTPRERGRQAVDLKKMPRICRRPAPRWRRGTGPGWRRARAPRGCSRRYGVVVASIPARRARAAARPDASRLTTARRPARPCMHRRRRSP